MQALANQLSIQESVVGVGTQIFKLASMNNFIQGRRTDLVAAVCLYSACRKEKPCRVMLIDFADKTQVCCFRISTLASSLTHIGQRFLTWSILQSPSQANFFGC